MDDVLCFMNLLDFCLKIFWIVTTVLENSFKSLPRESSSCPSSSSSFESSGMLILAKITRKIDLLFSQSICLISVSYHSQIYKAGWELTSWYLFHSDYNLKKKKQFFKIM